MRSPSGSSASGNLWSPGSCGRQLAVFLDGQSTSGASQKSPWVSICSHQYSYLPVHKEFLCYWLQPLSSQPLRKDSATQSGTQSSKSLNSLPHWHEVTDSCRTGAANRSVSSQRYAAEKARQGWFEADWVPVQIFLSFTPDPSRGRLAYQPGSSIEKSYRWSLGWWSSVCFWGYCSHSALWLAT